MIYTGIDVGAKGALVCINKEEILFQDYDMKKYIDILSSISKKKHILLIEKVHAMPKQGVVSTFTFGEKLGWILGVCDTLRLNYRMIAPQRWMSQLGVSGKKNIANKMLNLYPNEKNQLFGSRGGLKDGRSDALALAYLSKFIKE